MAVAFPSSTQDENGGAGGTSVTVTANPPTGLASGDRWVIVAILDDNNSDTIDTPSGFTPVHAEYDGADSGYPSIRTYQKLAGASETAVTVGVASGVEVYDCVAIGIRLTGAHATAPIGNISSVLPTGNSTTITPPSITVQDANSGCLIIGACSGSGATNPTSITPDETSMTELQSREGPNTYPQISVCWEAPGAGSYQPDNFTLSSNGSDRIGITIEFLPAGIGGAGGRANRRNLKSAGTELLAM